jgi:phasin family protein
MSDSDDPKADASAEKAYAEALQAAAPVKPAPVAEAVAQPVEPEAATMTIPAVKPKAAAKPKATAKPAKVAAPKVAAKPAAKSAKPAPKAPKAKAKVAKPKIAKPVAKKVPVAAAVIAVPARKTPPPTISAPAKTKDTTMTMKTKITEGFETVIGEAQSKAKEAFEKSTAMLGDYADFAKGNVEAVVESGKILAEGLQDMGTNLVAEGRATFETVTADIKEMAAAKSPTDLIQLQGEMFRKSFDSAVAYGSKNTEAMLKIASDAMAPISGRMTLAVEKVRSAAI